MPVTVRELELPVGGQDVMAGRAGEKGFWTPESGGRHLSDVLQLKLQVRDEARPGVQFICAKARDDVLAARRLVDGEFTGMERSRWTSPELARE